MKKVIPNFYILNIRMHYNEVGVEGGGKSYKHLYGLNIIEIETETTVE